MTKYEFLVMYSDIYEIELDYFDDNVLYTGPSPRPSPIVDFCSLTCRECLLKACCDGLYGNSTSAYITVEELEKFINEYPERMI